MANCSNVINWSPVPAGSRFCVSASATSDDFNCGARIIGEDGSDASFMKAEVVPGPAHRSLGQQGYAARLALTPGPTGPIVTMNAWIEDENDKRLFECTWQNAVPSQVRRVSIFISPAVAPANPPANPPSNPPA